MKDNKIYKPKLKNNKNNNKNKSNIKNTKMKYKKKPIKMKNYKRNKKIRRILRIISRFIILFVLLFLIIYGLKLFVESFNRDDNTTTQSNEVNTSTQTNSDKNKADKKSEDAEKRPTVNTFSSKDMKSDSKEVVNIDASTSKFVKEFTNAVLTRDYETVTGKEDLDFYTKETQKKLIERGYPDEVVSFYKKYSLKENLEIFDIKIYMLEGSQSSVVVNAKVRVVSANEDYEKYVAPVNSLSNLELKIVLANEDNKTKVAYYYPLSSNFVDEYKDDGKIMKFIKEFINKGTT